MTKTGQKCGERFIRFIQPSVLRAHRKINELDGAQKTVYIYIMQVTSMD